MEDPSGRGVVAECRRVSVPRGVPFWRRGVNGEVVRLAHDYIRKDVQRVRFKYAPPISAIDNIVQSQLPDPPFKDAPSYMCSVYYYWRQFLREHEGYIKYCESGTGNKFDNLFKDFGDVRDGDFWRWWSDGGYCLFHEQGSVLESLGGPPDGRRSTEELLVRVSLKADIDSIVDELRALLRNRLRPSKATSTARYPVASTPYLSALYQTLAVRRCWRAYPDASNSEVADLAGLPGWSMADPADSNIRSEKSMAVSRALKRARQLVEGAGMGVFPARGGSERAGDRDASAATRNDGLDEAQQRREFGVPRRYDAPPDGHIRRSLWSRRVSAAALLPRALKEHEFIAERLALVDGHAATSHRMGEPHDGLWAGHWGGGAKIGFDPVCHEGCRVIVFCPPDGFSVTDSNGRPFLSLCADTEEADTLYRMLVFQNQIPLHWCFLSSLAGAGGGEERTSAADGRRFIMQLTRRLTDVRAIVLLGKEQQAAWAALELNIDPHVQVWRPQRPTAALRKNDPLSWAAIPRQLPARYHLEVATS